MTIKNKRDATREMEDVFIEFMDHFFFTMIRPNQHASADQVVMILEHGISQLSLIASECNKQSSDFERTRALLKRSFLDSQNSATFDIVLAAECTDAVKELCDLLDHVGK